MNEKVKLKVEYVKLEELIPKNKSDRLSIPSESSTL